ncbi:MAG: 50S ribosomal protein L17 [Saprospiraceae bacterium]
MRHGKKFNHLKRKKGHRTALLKALSIELIRHKRIRTTLAKAKALRQHVEPIITRSKSNTTHDRRVAFSYLQNKEAIKELFGAVAAKVAGRPGGYTRVIRTGFRQGDGAEMAIIELVDFNETYTAGAEKAGKKTRRRRGGSKKTQENTAPVNEKTTNNEAEDKAAEE